MKIRNLVIAASALFAVSTAACAGGNWNVSIGYGVGAPVYAAPAPAYYAPPRAYYAAPAPQFAYYPPLQVVYPPVYRPAPVVVYAPRPAWYPPASYVSYSYGPRHGHGFGRGHHR